ncbi:hypothetical protein J3L16_07410 [Alteromonas sp. 5E99-2]|uniref:hypothetical protein n=1 Tax=Alteromonas sp. 5E99-2 TaxID=2817683 RepID=UPI001A995A76|nr:hypothetical protein [Alteromonas sp. 5E99-2]MBO1255507.1 hypothetical protein [Alteromonas sp. 5E99-2]
MQQEELDELMQASASDAVSTSQEEFSLELDFSSESIGLVDDVLLGFVDKYQDQALEDEAVFTLCNIYGAYVGEVFKKVVGGEWLYDNTDPEAPYLVLSYGSHTYAFAGICYERLVNNSQVSVRAYFNQAVSNNRN